jgi:hypothetical protein
VRPLQCAGDAIVATHRVAPGAGAHDEVAGVGNVAAGGMLLLAGLHTTSTVARLRPGLLVAGLATGVLNGGLGRQAVATAPPELAALGTGVNNTARLRPQLRARSTASAAARSSSTSRPA